jgi:hypothetical protein
MSDTDGGFLAGEQDGVAPEVDLRSRLPRELTEELAPRAGQGQEY